MPYYRYQDVLVRYQKKLADNIGTHLSTVTIVFKKLFPGVPSWNPGEDPYQLNYEEVRWGLGSTEVENSWRIHRIFEGHPIFFQSLAWFLAMSNEIIIRPE